MRDQVSGEAVRAVRADTTGGEDKQWQRWWRFQSFVMFHPYLSNETKHWLFRIYRKGSKSGKLDFSNGWFNHQLDAYFATLQGTYMIP